MGQTLADTVRRPAWTLSHILSLLPKGRGLDEEMWARRHRSIVVVLWVTAIGLTIFGIARGYGVTHSVLETSTLAAAAIFAMQPRGPRRLRSAVAACGLMAGSALLVHMWGGAIEGHFLFFVFVALLSVYQDWVPFLIALGFVVVHHGIVGVLIPNAVYDHADAIQSPWLWAAIHGAFVLAAAAANTYGWLSAEEDHRRAEDGLRKSEATFRALFDRNPQPMWVYDSQTLEILSVNNAAVEHYGFSKSEFLAMRLTDIVVPRTTTVLQSFSPTADVLPEPGVSEHRTSDGRIIKVIGHSDDLEFESHDARVQVMVDVTDRLGLEHELRHRALHDSLTGLGNRELFRDRLQHALARDRGHASVAVATFDLDGFKAINDAHGHAIGDALLAEIGKRTRAALRPEDTAARMGGDEFSMLFEGVGARQARRLIDRLLVVIAQPFLCDGIELTNTASAGIAVGNGATITSAEVIRRADIAMYEAKAAGKGCYRVFRPGMQSTMLHHLELAVELRGAAARGELLLEYQPLVDLQTRAILGVEALVRWRHPVRGIVSPLEFIPVAEETGVIVEIGAWVFREACRQLAAWRAAGTWADDLFMSVNVSPREIREAHFVDSLHAIIHSAGVPASRITVEVTETAVVEDIEQARDTLGKLRALGVRTAVDDFGAGYSSIGYLSTLPLDVIKIDRMFVTNLGQGKSKDLVVALVRLVDTLNVTTVMEGIETKEELDYATVLGLDLGQGYYFSRPTSPDKIESLFAARSIPSDDSDRAPTPVGVQVA
jgi:diguanylate cyclase (GGDEF)-like protein/PAS domain S-box-containing protein